MNSDSAGKTWRALIRWEACGEFVVEALVEFFTLLEGVLRDIDRIEKLHKNVAGSDFQFALLHDAVSVRARDRLPALPP